MSDWIQIYARAPKGSAYENPQTAKRIDEHISSDFPAAFVAPDGIPIKNDKGEYEIRCFVDTVFTIVESILTEHYGLEITRKERHTS